jgi:hypothetical protein
VSVFFGMFRMCGFERVGVFLVENEDVGLRCFP